MMIVIEIMTIIEKYLTDSTTKDKSCHIHVPFQGFHADLESVNSNNSEYYQVVTKTYEINHSVTASHDSGSEMNINIYYMAMNMSILNITIDIRFHLKNMLIFF